jgi:hypothetical protein
MSILGCKSTIGNTNSKLHLKFLSEFIVPENVIVDSTLVGGLSGIDYYNGRYYLVCDDASNPRFFEAHIEISHAKIINVIIDKVVRIKDTFNYLDLESIRYDAVSKRLFLTSEGHIKRQRSPLFFNVDASGNIENSFNIPEAFQPNSIGKPRHNGTLEGLSKSYSGDGYWLAMELPLEIDGPEPQLEQTKSPVRITYINTESNKVIKQFSYLLGTIAKKPLGNFAVNGLSELLEYEKDNFFVVERSYSSGLGNQGNTIKIFNVNAIKATNTLKMTSLKDKDYISATKELLFDFENVRNRLTNNSIDNIEGITFGPILSNGNRSLLLVADNNFNRMEKQLNQFILLEIVDNKLN